MKRHNCRIGNACERCADEVNEDRRADVRRDLIDGLAILLALGALIGACLLAAR